MLKSLISVWGDKLDKLCPLNEYPRPQLKREQWQCLNGVWNYAITQSSAAADKYDGEIIVPFSPECALSGVQRQLLPGQYLWYSRNFVFDMPVKGERLLLHFGAVDQCCTVYVNKKQAVCHEGGYWPFCADITELAVSGENLIEVCVTDFSDTGNEAYGKQKLSRGGIWYTAQSGIWQTVWCEKVPAQYIKSIKITPLYESGCVNVRVEMNEGHAEGTVKIFDGSTGAAASPLRNGSATVKIPQFKSWSPDSPFLYGLSLSCKEDKIESYFGMRVFGTSINKKGKPCLTLNGKPIFHNGLLDQGYWADGMYTAPSDEAVVWELSEIKAMGFNMLRKHIKTEPLRWYYHCDRLGLLVWQDFVSGGGPYKPFYTQYAPFAGLNFKDNKYSRFGRESEIGREAFLRDMHRTVELLYNCTSLALWVPFNEGWGQFDALKITAQLKKLDPTRLIDHASGYHDQGAGHLHSYHVYYKPFLHLRDRHGRALALTEFGGYSLPSEGHMSSDTLFGYKIFKSKKLLHRALQRLYRRDVLKHVKKGLCAAVYTQVSDVEDEINGIFTYDRREIKIDRDVLTGINNALYYEFEINYPE